MGLIDRMQPRHSLIVKVASTAFPDCFTLDMLRDIFPYADDIHHLPFVISELVDSGIFEEMHAPDLPQEIQSRYPEALTCYRFHSRLLKQQASALLPASDRQELERKTLVVVLNPFCPHRTSILSVSSAFRHASMFSSLFC